MENLEFEGSVEPDLLPLNANLPIKILTFDYQKNILHCSQFVQNCISTLETVKGWISLATLRVLMKSSRLRKLHWELYDEEIKPEEIASFQSNYSVKTLIVGDDIVKLKPISALLQKFESMTFLCIDECHDEFVIRSTKIKTFKMFMCNSDERFFNQLKLSLPNIENLILYNVSVQDDPSDPDIFMIISKQNWRLKSLKMRFDEYCDIPLDSLKNLIQKCPSLKFLELPYAEFVWNLNSFTSDRELVSGYIRNGLLPYDMKIRYLSDGSSKCECTPPIPVYCEQVNL